MLTATTCSLGFEMSMYRSLMSNLLAMPTLGRHGHPDKAVPFGFREILTEYDQSGY
jgi:hypothetical protein